LQGAAAWFLGQRPVSTIDKLVIDWVVPLDELRDAVDGVAGAFGGYDILESSNHVWQGRILRAGIKLQCRGYDMSSEEGEDDDDYDARDLDIRLLVDFDSRGIKVGAEMMISTSEGAIVGTFNLSHVEKLVIVV
jgi:hypothetical protein